MTEIHSERTPFRMPWWLGWVLMTGIALFFLWEEHEAHIIGALPYALLLLCPIIHLFMQRGHGGHGGGGAGRHEHEGHGAHRPEGGRP